MARPRTDRLASFYAKVRVVADGCHEWQAGRDQLGYGWFWGPDAAVRAHRWIYEQAVRPLRDGECVLHRCDNPACVRLDHLFVGSRADNNADKARKGRSFSYRGAEHWNAKLTAENVRTIRALHARGVRQKDLARRFGLCRSSVWNIIHRRTWLDADSALTSVR